VNGDKMKNIERIPSFIPGLDSMIENGFEEKSIILVAGSSGTGKTIFATQWAYHGIINKRNCLYLSFEELREPFFLHAGRFGWDLEKFEKKKKFKFIRYPPIEVEKFITDAPYIKDIIDEYNIQQVVLDSVTSLLLLQETEYKQRETFFKVTEILRDWDCTTLLTSEAQTTSEPTTIQPRFNVEYLVDAYLALYMIRKRDIRERAMEIIKMRGTKHMNKIAPFKITNKGIEIYPNNPVFGGV